MSMSTCPKLLLMDGCMIRKREFGRTLSKAPCGAYGQQIARLSAHEVYCAEPKEKRERQLEEAAM